MENYRIEFSNKVEKDFDRLDKGILRRVWSKIDDLAMKPYGIGCKKLIDTEFYRVRIGDYRVIYEINEKLKIVTILRVKHRKDVYKDI